MPGGDAHHGPDEHAHLSGSSASGASASTSRSAARKGSKGSPHIMHSAAPSGTGSRQRGQRSVSSWSLCLRRKNRILSPVGSWSGKRDPLGYGRARPCIKDPIRVRLVGALGAAEQPGSAPRELLSLISAFVGRRAFRCRLLGGTGCLQKGVGGIGTEVRRLVLRLCRVPRGARNRGGSHRASTGVGRRARATGSRAPGRKAQRTARFCCRALPPPRGRRGSARTCRG